MDLPNKTRNDEVKAAIDLLKSGKLDLGASTEKHIGIANALASLDVAESLQITSVQIEESSSQDRVALNTAVHALISSNEKLAESNKKYARAMMWLTGAIVLVGVAQIIASFFAK
ncbi:MAG TPA: hypothetical protein VMA75_00455 [Candidatus Paceibacterota bacterium]|nr:hypothetical protein [Candidatus Paceibacterota bacterium]